MSPLVNSQAYARSSYLIGKVAIYYGDSGRDRLILLVCCCSSPATYGHSLTSATQDAFQVLLTALEELLVRWCVSQTCFCEWMACRGRGRGRGGDRGSGGWKGSKSRKCHLKRGRSNGPPPTTGASSAKTGRPRTWMARCWVLPTLFPPQYQLRLLSGRGGKMLGKRDLIGIRFRNFLERNKSCDI